MKSYLIILVLSIFIAFISSHPVRRDSQPECGAYGANLDKILTAIGRDQVIPCCKRHDMCYRNCSASKNQCDTEFGECVYDACIAKVGFPSYCKVESKAGYEVVEEFGGPAYSSNQMASGCSQATNVKTDSSSSSGDIFDLLQIVG